MPRRITNLRGIDSSNINVLTYSKNVNNGTKKYVLFKLLLPLTYGDYYKRARIRIRITNITDAISILIKKLTYYDFNNFDYDYIDSYLINTYYGMAVDSSESSIDTYLDLTPVLKDQYQDNQDMYFGIVVNGNNSFSVDNYDFNNNEELIVEIMNENEEKKIHEKISMDAGIAGSGIIDLFNRDISLCMLNVNSNRENSISLSANYYNGNSGIFGDNVSANFEYRIKIINNYYIKLKDCTGNTNVYNYVSRSFAHSTYQMNIDGTITNLYLNFDDLSYLVYENGKWCLHTLSNEKIIFHSYSNKLLINQIITSTRIINYNIENNKVKSIECDDDCINITYTSNLVTRIDYNYNYNIIFEYQTYDTSVKLLKKISYYKYDLKLDQDILIARAVYQYTDNRLTEAYDDLTKIGLVFDYTCSYNKYYIYEVITKHMDNDNEIIKRMRVEYDGNIAYVTNELGDINYYCLDDEGKCHLMIDSEKNHKSMQYIENPVIGGNDLLVGETDLLANARNYINNPYFKLDGSNIISWTQDIHNYADFELCLGKNGETGLHIYNIRYSSFKLSQSLNALINNNPKQLYFYGNIRGSGNIFINIKINNVDDIYSFSAKSIWQEISFEKI